MFRIAPSILAADFGRLAEKVREVETAGADLLHVDIMDGHFVPNLSVGIPVVESLRRCTALTLDVHLMIERPAEYVPAFASAGAQMISVHVEADFHLHRTMHLIRECGALPGVAINPATPLNHLQEILSEADYVLIMSVNPGFGGQKFIPRSLDRIRLLRSMIRDAGLRTQIEVDGGVMDDNYREVVQAGTDILIAGSAIFRSPNPGQTLRSWIKWRESLNCV